jgi:hypothetical protein
MERTLARVPARPSRVPTSDTMIASTANTTGRVAAGGATIFMIVIATKGYEGERNEGQLEDGIDPHRSEKRAAAAWEFEEGNETAA